MNLSLIYRKYFPQNLRIKIRNIQYQSQQLLFLIQLCIFNINNFIFKPKRIDVKSPKPSICYIIPTTNITGGVAVVCEHLNRLNKLGFKTLIVSYDNKTDLSWFPNQLVKVLPLNGNKKIIESHDIVVATGWITAYILRLINAKRKIYFVQSDETRFYPKGSYLINRVSNTYTFPFEFITEAKWIQKWLKTNYDQEAEYVPNGINTEIFYPDKPIEPKPKNKKRILIEGAINLPFKGMKEAFEVVQDLDCEVWCISYDGRPKAGWRCDKFFEKVPMDKMRNIYSACDILLKLSKVEGFFGPPLEMMACGGIPVVSKVTGYDEYIIDNINALVVDNNINKTKKILNKFLLDEKLFKKLRVGAQQTVQKMKWDTSIQKLSSFFLQS